MLERRRKRTIERMMYGHHMGAGGWVLSIFVTLGVLALAVFFVVTVLNNQRSSAAPSTGAGSGMRSESARELLDRRLASGEIGEEEYRRIRQTLSEPHVADAVGSGSPPTAGPPTAAPHPG